MIAFVHVLVQLNSLCYACLLQLGERNADGADIAGQERFNERSEEVFVWHLSQ